MNRIVPKTDYEKAIEQYLWQWDQYRSLAPDIRDGMAPPPMGEQPLRWALDEIRRLRALLPERRFELTVAWKDGACTTGTATRATLATDLNALASNPNVRQINVKCPPHGQ